MIRDVVSHLDYSLCAEISLTIFVLVFMAIGIQTLLLKQSDVDHMASLPLEEGHREKI